MKIPPLYDWTPGYDRIISNSGDEIWWDVDRGHEPGDVHYSVWRHLAPCLEKLKDETDLTTLAEDYIGHEMYFRAAQFALALGDAERAGELVREQMRRCDEDLRYTVAELVSWEQGRALGAPGRRRRRVELS